MAYITKETVKDIRNALKKEFPQTKFSVRLFHNMKVSVSIMTSPYFDDDINMNINHNWLDRYPEDAKVFLKRVDEIIRTTGDYYNNTDIMTDYFDVAFYYDIEVGKWDKPHSKVEAK